MTLPHQRCGERPAQGKFRPAGGTPPWVRGHVEARPIGALGTRGLARAFLTPRWGVTVIGLPPRAASRSRDLPWAGLRRTVGAHLFNSNTIYAVKTGTNLLFGVT